MKISRLFALELEKNSLRPYQLAVIISAFFMLGFIYLMAAIPKIDPSDSDAELFGSYSFIVGLTLVVVMGIFSIISAVMASRFIVEEYSGKKTILLFSYPINRKRIIGVKILLVFLFTILSMLVCGLLIISVFLTTESLLPICNDIIDLSLIFRSIIGLICYAFIAGFCGVISCWFGFRRKSVITTIVASCIIVVVVCQIAAMSVFAELSMVVLLVAVGLLAFCAASNLLSQVQKMQI